MRLATRCSFGSVVKRISPNSGCGGGPLLQAESTAMSAPRYIARLKEARAIDRPPRDERQCGATLPVVLGEFKAAARDNFGIVALGGRDRRHRRRVEPVAL